MHGFPQTVKELALSAKLLARPGAVTESEQPPANEQVTAESIAVAESEFVRVAVIVAQ